MNKKTRNELLDRLIDSLENNKLDIYYSWANRPTLTSWENSFEYNQYEQLDKEIEGLRGQYD